MHDQSTASISGVVRLVTNYAGRVETVGFGAIAADALSELAHLAIEGASRADLAACATGWLERMVPGCRAVVIQAAPGTDEAFLLSDTEASGMHLHARFSFGEGSAIAQAFREPLKAFRASGPGLSQSVSGYAVKGTTVLVCAGIIGKGSERAVLAALMDRERLEANRDMDVAMPILASQLAVALSVAKNRAAAAKADAAIARAKLEWERTVDALGEIVCLLDAEGRVVRANRVVERWGLGDVSVLIGRRVHELFHPVCQRPRCALATAIGAAWNHLKQGRAARFECREHEIDRDLLFNFRPLPSESAAPLSPGEVHAVLVVTDVSELRQARDTLHRLNEGLETTVRARTQELREANRGLRHEVVRRTAAEAALRASSSERGLLSEQLIVAQENERHHIARELHDGVGQSLSSVKSSIEQAIEVLRRSGLEDALPVLRRAERGTRDAAENIRAIATSLRPPALDDVGAVTAVRGFLLQFADIYRDIQFDLQISATDDDVPDRLAAALFRSAQEMLNNVVKHASAKRVGLTLVRQPLSLTLEVRDDGVGVPDGESAEPGSPGQRIRSLRERAELSGGHFDLLSGDEGGTVARTSWPLQRDEGARRKAT